MSTSVLQPGSIRTGGTSGSSTGGGSWTRRRFLGTLSAMAVGVASGCGLSGDSAEDFSGGGGAGRLGAAPRSGSGGSAGLTPQPPLGLQVACELSEDYFLVTNHQIDPKKGDKVVAYSRADGAVEGVVLQDERLTMFYRDATEPGGWNVAAVPDAVDVAFMVAGMSGPVRYGSASGQSTVPTLKIFYVKLGEWDKLWVVTETTPGGDEQDPVFATDSVPWVGSLFNGLQIAVNFDNSLLVTSMVPTSSKDTLDGKLYYYADGLTANHTLGQPPTPACGSLTGFAFDQGWNNPLNGVGGRGSVTGWSAVVAEVVKPGGTGTPRIVLALPAGSYGPVKMPYTTITCPSVCLWSWELKPGQTTAAVAQSYLTSMGAPPVPTSSTSGYSVEALTVQGASKSPTALVRTSDTDGATQRLWLLSPNDTTEKWVWTELGLPTKLDPKAPVVLSTALRLVPSSEKNAGGDNITSFLDVFLVADGTLSVFREAPQADAVLDYTNPAFCPLIPLQPDVAVMTSQAGRSTGNELLVVGTDGTLHSLVKDPVTGHWADAVVHLKSSELQQVSAYRVELTAQDSWNTGVPHLPLRVTASTPVTAMVNGQTVRLGAQPVTLATDAQGQATVAIAADTLSAPTLTISADGIPDATVNPSAPINTYMQGGSRLNYQDKLDPDTLSNAQTPDGQSIFGSKVDLSDAEDGIANLSQAAGQAVSTSLTGARASATLSRRDGRAGSRNARGQVLTAQGILTDLDAWAHDALHGIAKGAIPVSGVSYDPPNKVFRFLLGVERWVARAVTIVVRGIEDAAHVFHAVLNKLGAAILKAVKWLEAEVLGLLKDTAALARQYDGWLETCTGFIGDQLTKDAGAVDRWLAAQQTTLSKRFTQLANGFAPGTTLSTMAANPPQGSRPARSLGRSPGAVGDADGAQGSPHGNWFLNKVKNALLGQLDLPEVAGLEEMITEVSTAMKSAGADFRAAFGDFWAFLEGVVEHPSQVSTMGVRDLLLALSKLIDAMFTMLRGVVVALMRWFASLARAIPDMLATPLSALPVVGELLKLIGLGSVKIGSLFTLLLAFPTVLAYKIAHGGKGRPFAGSSVGGRRRRTGLGDEAADLQFCAGGALLAWAGLDALSGAYTATELPAPMFFSAVDIAAPLIVTVLTVPTTTDGGEPFFSPPVSQDNADQMNFASWILGAIPAFSVATGVFIDAKLSTSPEATSLKAMLLTLTSACGVLSLATGCIGNQESSDPSGADYAVAVLNNMANIGALLLEDGFVKSSEGITAVVAAAITAVCGGIGAVVYGVEG